MKPTEEQAHIASVVRDTSDNVMINAYAGCGKTSTLEMLEQIEREKPALYLVFNKRNATEAERRMASTTQVRTFNSLGHRIWAQSTCRRLTLDSKKTNTLFKSLVDEAPKAQRFPMWDSYYLVQSGVAMAKALGYVPEGIYPNATRLITRTDLGKALEEDPDDLTSDLIDAVLARSIKAAYSGTIDYNDQIYMPALFGGTFPRFPLVKVDESQDLSPVNHAMLERLVKGRLIAVGDPFQNIYGFRGAKAGGMKDLGDRYGMTQTTLSVSFRCPSEIVKLARWRVPEFKWIKEGGHVEVLEKLSLADIPDDATILCRNNAPLFKLAIRLLIAGRSVSVAGTELGPRIVGIMKKFGEDSMSLPSLLSAIADWKAEKEAAGSKIAADMAECMKVFANAGKSLHGAIGYAEHLFAQQGSIRFSTGHKAKGLEFPWVLHIDPWLLRPSEQDSNLRYVIQTRSQDYYGEINSAGIE